MKTVTLRQHRVPQHRNRAKAKKAPDEMGKRAVFGAAKAREARDAPPITLPEVRFLTMDEIEKKYGKL